MSVIKPENVLGCILFFTGKAAGFVQTSVDAYDSSCDEEAN
jgi:hypothetical protein